MTGRITERMRLLRAQPLSKSESRLIDDIEKFGCHIIHMTSEHGIPGWSYTIGLTELMDSPELIVVGLPDDVAQSLLNECAARLRSRARIDDRSRQSELLEGVECEFRGVEQRWLRRTMGFAVWFYGDDKFRAMQCVYPDLANHFPWDDGFDESWRVRQPLLFTHSLSPRVEEDFWSTNDPSSSLFGWKFADGPHTGVYTVKQVLDGEVPVTRVFHDLSDGAWQFHGPDDFRIEDGKVVCFHHIIDKDPSVAELADLPLGWYAWREDAASPWVRDVQGETDESEEN